MATCKFCTACGCNVEEHMQFCPQCGRPLEGTQAAENALKAEKNLNQMAVEGQRSMLFFALFVYALPAIIIGLIVIVDSGNTADTIWNNSNFKQAYESHHWNFTLDDMKTYIICIGAMELVSGVLAAISAYHVRLGKKRKIAFIFCIIAAVLCCWSVVGMLLGFLVAWSIFDAKEIFTDEDSE